VFEGEARNRQETPLTGRWGFGQFDKVGKPAKEALLKTCFPCHVAISVRDFAFTCYTP
jgi:Cytochrome P460